MPAIRPLMSEFSLRDAEGDATEEIVTAPGRVYMLCVTSFDRLPRGCAKRFAKVVRRAAEEGPASSALPRSRCTGSLTTISVRGMYGAIT